nr:DUF1993 domain-containing protein [uncultured Pseudomonas sp.]
MHPKNIFLRYLKQLRTLVDKIEAHAGEGMLSAALSDDMFPLLTQARIAANFSLRACCPLAGTEVLSFDNDEFSFAGLKKQLSQTIDYLQALDIPNADGGAAEVRENAGFAKIALPVDDYVHALALPNFFFHIGMVYAIAKSHGVPVSKGDYDGYHSYPQGFSFVLEK